MDAAAAAAYCTLEGAAQIRPADGFLHNYCPNSRGFTKGFSNMGFYKNVDYHFLTETIFPTMCTAIPSYSVGGGLD